MSENLPYSQQIYLAQGRYSFSKQNLIGKGATGNVYQGIDYIENKSVAIKEINISKMNLIERNLIQNQKRALKIIKHEYVIKVLHVEDKLEFTYIITQLYQGGSLKQCLQRQGKFSQQNAMQFFRKIINGYCAILQANIIHRDLKPANILLTRQKDPIIIDFGYSQIIIANKNLTVFNVGSPSYMSPEAYNKTIYSEKSDVWSLGAIFYELLTKKTLDHGVQTKQHFKNMQQMEYPSMNLEQFGQVVKEILKGSLAIKAQKRMTCHKIKYLLDKEIIGKKLCKKNLLRTQQNEGWSVKLNYDKMGSEKKLSQMLKQIDYIKMRNEQDGKNMKKKALTVKTIDCRFYNEDNLLSKPIQSELQQRINLQSKLLKQQRKSFENVGLRKQIINFGTKAVSSISRIQIPYERIEKQKNCISSIKIINQSKGSNSNKNIQSTLTFRSPSKANLQNENKMRNPTDIKSNQTILKNNFLNQNIRLIDQNNAQNLRNWASVTNEYFDQSRDNKKHLTCNQGFYRRQYQSTVNASNVNYFSGKKQQFTSFSANTSTLIQNKNSTSNLQFNPQFTKNHFNLNAPFSSYSKTSNQFYKKQYNQNFSIPTPQKNNPLNFSHQRQFLIVNNAYGQNKIQKNSQSHQIRMQIDTNKCFGKLNPRNSQYMNEKANFERVRQIQREKSCLIIGDRIQNRYHTTSINNSNFTQVQSQPYLYSPNSVSCSAQTSNMGNFIRHNLVNNNNNSKSIISLRKII